VDIEAFFFPKGDHTDLRGEPIEVWGSEKRGVILAMGQKIRKFKL
jgi:hypothetical protein